MIRRWFSLARTPGALVTWGDGFHTQLGHPTSGKLYRPKRVENVTAVDVFMGPRHSLVLTPENKLLAFGANEYGQLGIGNSDEVTTPRPVCELQNVKTAACGMNYSLAVTETGDLYHWGYSGRTPPFLKRLMGMGISRDHIHPTPTRVDAFRSASILDVAAGEQHFLAVMRTFHTESGAVYAWGDNEFGQLGNDEPLVHQPLPARLKFFDSLPNQDKVARVFACGASSAALTEQGRVFAWGKNDQGQIAVPTEEPDYKSRYVIEPQPQLLKTLLSEPVLEVAMGLRTISFLTKSRVLFAGMSIWGQPFNAEVAKHYSPVSVACGEDYYAFLDKRGQVVTMGGPFIGRERPTDDLPEGMTLVPKTFFDGKVAMMKGPYDYLAAIVY